MLDRVVKFNTLINDAEKETLIYPISEVRRYSVLLLFGLKTLHIYLLFFPLFYPTKKQIFFLFEKKTYIPFLSLRERNHNCLLCQPLNCSQSVTTSTIQIFFQAIIHFCCLRKHRSAEVFRCSSFSVGNWDKYV